MFDVERIHFMSKAFGYIIILDDICNENSSLLSEWCSDLKEALQLDAEQGLKTLSTIYFKLSGKCFTEEEIEQERSLMEFAAMKRNNSLKLIKENAYTLIYHQEFTLMNINSYACSLSNKIPNRIMYYSGIIGEGLIVGIYEHGQIVLCHQTGDLDCLESHGLLPVRGSKERIINNLPMFDSVILSKFIKKRNAFYAQELFENAMPEALRKMINQIKF